MDVKYLRKLRKMSKNKEINKALDKRIEVMTND